MNHADYMHIFPLKLVSFWAENFDIVLDDVAATAEKGSAGYVYQNIRWHFLAVALPDLYLTILMDYLEHKPAFGIF